MTLEAEVAALTTATNDLLAAVNVRKTALDTAVTDAETQVALATTQATNSSTYASNSAGSASTASTHASTASTHASTATTKASEASASAAAAASAVLGQTTSKLVLDVIDQSVLASTTLVDAFVYDTSLATDGGRFIDRLSGTSLSREALSGTWRGRVAGASLAAAETTVRAMSGATTGDFFQYLGDRNFYTLSAGSGTAATLRGNTAKFPRRALLVVESAALFVFDMTAPDVPLWRKFPVGANEVIFATPTAIAAAQSTIAISTISGLLRIDIASDSAIKYTTGSDQRYKGGLAVAGAGWN